MFPDVEPAERMIAPLFVRVCWERECIVRSLLSSCSTTLLSLSQQSRGLFQSLQESQRSGHQNRAVLQRESTEFQISLLKIQPLHEEVIPGDPFSFIKRT